MGVAYQVLQRTLLVTVTGRVMVQGQSVMVRVVGWCNLVSRRVFRELVMLIQVVNTSVTV